MHEAELMRGLHASRAARELIERWFAGTIETMELYTAKLLTSELVSNAVLHGEGRISLRAELDEDRLFVEVQDEGDGLPAIREGRWEGERRWGLKIVDAAASRWGAHEGTSHVWFELERPGPRLGTHKNPAIKDDMTEPPIAEPEGDRAGFYRRVE